MRTPLAGPDSRQDGRAGLDKSGIARRNGGILGDSFGSARR